MKPPILLLIVLSSIRVTHVYALPESNDQVVDLLESRIKPPHPLGPTSSDGIGSGSSGGAKAADVGGVKAADSGGAESPGAESPGAESPGAGSPGADGTSAAGIGYECYSCENLAAGDDKETCVSITEGSTTQCYPDLHGEPAERGCNMIAGYLKPDASEPVQFVHRACDNIPSDATAQLNCDDLSKLPDFVKIEMSLSTTEKQDFYVRDCYCTTQLCNSASLIHNATTGSSENSNNQSADHNLILEAIKELKREQLEKATELANKVDNVEKKLESVNGKK